MNKAFKNFIKISLLTTSLSTNYAEAVNNLTPAQLQNANIYGNIGDNWHNANRASNAAIKPSEIKRPGYLYDERDLHAILVVDNPDRHVVTLARDPSGLVNPKLAIDSAYSEFLNNNGSDVIVNVGGHWAAMSMLQGSDGKGYAVYSDNGAKIERSLKLSDAEVTSWNNYFGTTGTNSEEILREYLAGYNVTLIDAHTRVPNGSSACGAVATEVIKLLRKLNNEEITEATSKQQLQALLKPYLDGDVFRLEHADILGGVAIVIGNIVANRDQLYEKQQEIEKERDHKLEVKKHAAEAIIAANAAKSAKTKAQAVAEIEKAKLAAQKAKAAADRVSIQTGTSITDNEAINDAKAAVNAAQEVEKEINSIISRIAINQASKIQTSIDNIQISSGIINNAIRDRQGLNLVSAAAGDNTEISYGSWLKLLMGVSSTKTDSGNSKSNTFGFTVGADTEINNDFTIGLAYSHVKDNSKLNGDKTEFVSNVGSLYGAKFILDQLMLSGNASVGKIDIKLKGDDESKSKADLISINTALSYSYNMHNNTYLMPELAFAYTSVDLGSFAANELSVNKTKTNKYEVKPSIMLKRVMQLNGLTVTPEAKIGYDFNLNSKSNNLDVIDASGVQILSKKNKSSNYTFRAGAGVSIVSNSVLELGLGYDFAKQNKSDFHTGYLKLRVNF